MVKSKKNKMVELYNNMYNKTKYPNLFHNSKLPKNNLSHQVTKQ